MARKFKVLSNNGGSVLYDDLVGPEGNLEGPCYGGTKTKVWTSYGWQRGFAVYNFREEATSPPLKTSTTSSPPHFWAAAKKRRKEKRRMLLAKVERRERGEKGGFRTREVQACFKVINCL